MNFRGRKRVFKEAEKSAYFTTRPIQFRLVMIADETALKPSVRFFQWVNSSENRRLGCPQKFSRNLHEGVLRGLSTLSLG